MIEVYNSLTRSLETFVPNDPSFIRMYVCGPTVYSTPHLGNARPAVVFDVLYRLLSVDYPKVMYARNLTDIDDKIIDRAKEMVCTIDQLTEQTIAEYHQIVDLLGCRRPDAEPRATQSIASIIRMIAALLSAGHAYEGDGHVLFDLASYPDHGALSRHVQMDLQSGQHRVEPASYKRSAGDFILWKPSDATQPGWSSPWGFGRPGWHIECSAMIDDVFESAVLDIHGGGADLRFPHHDCEISQTACAHGGRPLASIWMHNGMVLSGGRKMSKSTGNFVTVRDLVSKGYSGRAIRMALLSAHYRQPLNLVNQLDESALALEKWDKIVRECDTKLQNGHNDNRIEAALRRDLNTPSAFAQAHALAAHFLNGKTVVERSAIANELKVGLQTLGLDMDGGVVAPSLNPYQFVVFSRRLQARQDRDYKLADQLRAELLALGVSVKDTKEGSTWELTKN